MGQSHSSGIGRYPRSAYRSLSNRAPGEQASAVGVSNQLKQYSQNSRRRHTSTAELSGVCYCRTSLSLFFTTAHHGALPSPTPQPTTVTTQLKPLLQTKRTKPLLRNHGQQASGFHLPNAGSQVRQPGPERWEHLFCIYYLILYFIVLITAMHSKRASPFNEKMMGNLSFFFPFSANSSISYIELPT